MTLLTYIHFSENLQYSKTKSPSRVRQIILVVAVLIAVVGIGLGVAALMESVIFQTYSRQKCLSSRILHP